MERMQKFRLFNAGGMVKGRVIQKFDDCKLKNIYNADETGLFFRCPSNKTLSLKGVFHIGGKTAKERLTVLLACSAAETDELPLVVTGSVKILVFKTPWQCTEPFLSTLSHSLPDCSVWDV
jgi:hypothetical protein